MDCDPGPPDGSRCRQMYLVGASVQQPEHVADRFVTRPGRRRAREDRGGLGTPLASDRADEVDAAVDLHQLPALYPSIHGFGVETNGDQLAARDHAVLRPRDADDRPLGAVPAPDNCTLV